MSSSTGRSSAGFFSEDDSLLFLEGRHYRLYEKLGAHPVEHVGTRFGVWAPKAGAVAVAGETEAGQWREFPLQRRDDGTGIWEGFVPDIQEGARYRFSIRGARNGEVLQKTDPFSFSCSNPAGGTSRVVGTGYSWGDAEWMKRRGSSAWSSSPVSIYELDYRLWRRVPEEENRPLSFRELAVPLVAYLHKQRFTHVELMPVVERYAPDSSSQLPYGAFSTDSRCGSHRDLMYLVDYLHRSGIGVIFEWIPLRFVSNAHGLARFDTGRLFEREDGVERERLGWEEFELDYARPEIRQFLISNAHFWFDRFHIDGLCVPALDSVLYLDLDKPGKKWVRNRYGGRENLEGIEFIRALNLSVRERFPDVQMIAAQADSWPMVTRPVYIGGLGFDLKWNRSWVESTLSYLSREPIHRKYHHEQLGLDPSASIGEHSILALSHEESGDGPLLARMAGDEWQRYANLRLLFGYLYSYPGKKLLYMGSEFGLPGSPDAEHIPDRQFIETGYGHGLAAWVGDLNSLYRNEPALHSREFSEAGFAWLDYRNWEESILCFLRTAGRYEESVVVACNFTPVPRRAYRVGVPASGFWEEECNSDSIRYGGSGMGNPGRVASEAIPYHGYGHSVTLTLPPLGVLFLRWKGTV